jgi:hypothetical protein
MEPRALQYDRCPTDYMRYKDWFEIKRRRSGLWDAVNKRTGEVVVDQQVSANMVLRDLGKIMEVRVLISDPAFLLVQIVRPKYND